MLSEDIANARIEAMSVAGSNQITTDVLEQILREQGVMVEVTGNSVSVAPSIEALVVTLKFRLSGPTGDPQDEEYSTVIDVPEQGALTNLVDEGMKKCRLLFFKEKLGVKAVSGDGINASPAPFPEPATNNSNVGMKTIKSLTAATM